MIQTVYVVITPVRDEAEHIGKTIQSMAAQTILPRCWVIVDDGSTDQTARIIDSAAQAYPWIRVVHRADRGFRKSGGGVIEAFYEGWPLIADDAWDFLVKLDGDLSFAPYYFAACLERFKSDPRLGLGGGTVCVVRNDRLEVDSFGDPPFHVRGATKIYRRKCWEQISPLEKTPGWDTIDEVKANMYGWRTYTFPDLELIQHKATGSGDGLWRNWIKNGLANYITGYHPLFMLIKCMKRVVTRPYGLAALALGIGFLYGYVHSVSKVPDRTLIRYLQKQQINRLLMHKSIYG